MEFGKKHDLDTWIDWMATILIGLFYVYKLSYRTWNIPSDDWPINAYTLSIESVFVCDLCGSIYNVLNVTYCHCEFFLFVWKSDLYSFFLQMFSNKI